jgi:hypothetical protein
MTATVQVYRIMLWPCATGAHFAASHPQALLLREANARRADG